MIDSPLFEQHVEPTAVLRDAADILAGFRFRFASEVDLQDGINQALFLRGIGFTREKALTQRDRPDFLLSTGVAIEVKVAGSLSDLIRQCSRYAEHPDVTAVLAVGTPSWLNRVPQQLASKPLLGLRITASLF
ncbi:MAG: hypothetical protein EPN79_11840 [Burkholderiaceae bacterium]|nr:MAG: hypothetical protein EPN79_11840 [Burkholderiaceae bacterium]TBR76652.1 MAG: hypothetical protein EPN64_05225 [Burkholderiaceae bacterium]